MTYVLHTQAVAALMKGSLPVIRNLMVISPSQVSVPQPVMAEIAFGIARLPESRRRAALQKQFDLICAELPRAEWTEEVSLSFALIKAQLERRGVPIDDFDAAIAAHAMARHATLVTAKAQHMTRIPGLTVADWSR